MRLTLIPLATLITVLAPSMASAGSTGCAALPANFQVAPMYRSTVETLVARSPTLTRQCLTIAAAHHVTVTLHAAQAGDHCRARTSFRRLGDGRLRASIAIPPSADFAELLAHELEHVVEQIEDIDLVSLAAIRNSGVHRVGRNVFETMRAKAAGLRAAGELVACRPDDATCVRHVPVLASLD